MNHFSPARLFRLGGWVCVATAVSHLIGHLLPIPISGLAEAQLIDQMVHIKKDVMGGSLTMMDVQNGLSLCYSLFFLIIGIICLVIYRSGQVKIMRDVSIVLSAGFFTGAMISLVYFFWIPTVTFFMLMTIFALCCRKKYFQKVKPLS